METVFHAEADEGNGSVEKEDEEELDLEEDTVFKNDPSLAPMFVDLANRLVPGEQDEEILVFLSKSM